MMPETRVFAPLKMVWSICRNLLFSRAESIVSAASLTPPPRPLTASTTCPMRVWMRPKSAWKASRPGGGKGVGEKSGQSLDPGHNKLQRRGDRLGHRSKELSLLGRLVDADQEISDPCGYGENAVSQRTGSAAQRRQSIENRQRTLPHQVQHREKPLEGAPQLVRRLLGEGQPLRKAAESLRKGVQLVGGCWPERFRGMRP